MDNSSYCTWKETVDPSALVYWETNCDNAFMIESGTPAENGFRFCCYCGRLLKTELPISVKEEENENSND